MAWPILSKSPRLSWEPLSWEQGRRIRGFEGAQAPPEHASAPSHCQKHLLKMKGNVMKHCFKLTSNKFMVVLTLILGLYLGKTDAIYRFTLNSMATSGKAPPRVSTILHPCLRVCSCFPPQPLALQKFTPTFCTGNDDQLEARPRLTC